MSMGIIKNGEYNKVAGQTQSGELVMGASTIRKGTVTCTVDAETNIYDKVVTFAEPMPDADYTVTLNCIGWNNDGSIYGTPYAIEYKTKNSFTIHGYKANTSNTTSITFEYTAFKLFTVEGLEDVENDVAALKNVEGGRATLTNIGITADTISVDYVKVGRLVTLRVFIANITSGQPAAFSYDWLSIGMLPAKLKPVVDCLIDCHFQATETPYVAEVKNDGHLGICQWGQPTAIGNGANVTFTVTYVTAN